MEPRASVERLLENATWLRALARQMLSDRGLAEDAAQETWLAALRSPPAVADERSWLARVLHNAVRQRARAESARARRERVSARPEGLPPTDEIVARAELHARLVKAVLALEEPFKSTLLLRYFEELPAEEIARRAGVDTATVRSRTARAREKLRASLMAHGGEEPERWLAALVATSGPGAAPVADVGKGLAAPAGAGGLLVGLKLGAVMATITLVALAMLWRGTSGGHERGSAPALAREGSGAALPTADAELAPGTEPQGRTRREESATPPAALEATTPLAGTVLSEDGRAPIAGARVALRRGREDDSTDVPAAERTGPAVLTDEHGRFALARPEHPEDGLWIEADGHFPYKLSAEDLPRSDGNEVEAVLAPLGRLELELVDDLQQPVPFKHLEYSIDVNRGSNDFLWSHRGGIYVGESDAAGRKVLEGLPCGMPIHLEPADRSAGWETFGTHHIDPALRVLALRVVIPRRARIVGRLVDEKGEPVRSEVIWQSRSLGRSTQRAWAATEGRFEFTSVVPGPCEVRIELDGAEPRALTTRAGEVVDLGDLVVPARAELAGRLMSRHFTPECIGQALGTVELRPFRAGRVVSELDPDGDRFAKVLTRGPLELLVTRTDFWQEGQVLVRLPLVGPATGLELSLDEVCGAVEFELGAHRPPADEDVFVRLFAAEGAEFGRLVTAAQGKPDGAGRVRVALVTPGSYRATLSLGDGPDASTAPFEVRAGELTLVPEPTFASLRLAGRVVDAAGVPVAHAIVRLRDWRYDQTLPSDADGRFAFEAVPRGRYELFVRHGERGALELDDVDVLRPDAPGVTLVLRGFAGLTGRVLAGGEPVAGLEISAQPDGSNDAYSAITDTDGAFAFERLPACRLRFWAREHFVEVHDLVAGETHALTIELGVARTLRFLRDGVPLADVSRALALALVGDSLARRHWRIGVAREDGFAFELPPGPALFEIERARADESWLALASPSGSEVELAPHTLRIETSEPWHGPLPRVTLVALDGHEVLSQWASPIPLAVERDAEGLSVPCLPTGARVRLTGFAANGQAFEALVDVSGSSSLAWP